MTRPTAAAPDFDGDDAPMATVTHLRPVARPELDRKADELRAAGLIGGDRSPRETSGTALTGEILPPPGRPRMTMPSLDGLRSALGDRDAASEVGRELALRATRGLLLAYPGAVLRGVAVAGRAWWQWVTAAEVKRAIIDANRLHDKYGEVRALAWSRLKLTAVVALPGGAVISLAALLAPALPVAVAAGVASLALAATGRRKDGTPGRKSVLPARRGVAWTMGGEDLERAFQEAGLVGKGQRLALTQRPARDGDGWAVVVDLPPGRKASAAIAKGEDLASALGVDEVQLILNRVRGKGGHAGRLSVWVADDDPYAAQSPGSPLEEMERFDFWKPVPFGSTARGQRIDLPMLWTSLLVGAIPRMGKTYAARIPATAAALDPSVRLIVWDGKGGKDWSPYEQVAHRIGIGDDDDTCARLLVVLEEAVADVQWRFLALRAMDDDLCPESKVTPAITSDPQLGIPLVVIAIDEVQIFLEDATPIEVGIDHRGKPKYRARGAIICDLLTYIAKKAPAAGYMLLLATQKPDAQVIPDKLRGQLGTRFALRVMTYQASETILGQGTKSAGYDSSRLLASHRGVGLLLGADGETTLDAGEAVTVRTDKLEIQPIRAACKRGRELRIAAGTLTGDAAGDRTIRARATVDADEAADAPPADAQGASEVPAILLDVRDAIEATGADRIRTATLLGALAAARPEYDGLTPSELSDLLGDNVSPTQLGRFDNMANPQGYKLAHVKAEIDRLTGA